MTIIPILPIHPILHSAPCTLHFVGAGSGLLVNEGTVDEPRFRVIMKGTEHYMERLAADLNRGDGESMRLVRERRRD